LSRMKERFWYDGRSDAIRTGHSGALSFSANGQRWHGDIKPFIYTTAAASWAETVRLFAEGKQGDTARGIAKCKVEVPASIMALEVASKAVRETAMRAQLHRSSVSMPAIVQSATDAAKDGMTALKDALDACSEFKRCCPACFCVENPMDEGVIGARVRTEEGIVTKHAFNGTIVEADTTRHGGGRLWKVAYDDGDFADLTTEELLNGRKAHDANVIRTGFTHNAEADEVYLGEKVTYAGPSDAHTNATVREVVCTLDGDKLWSTAADPSEASGAPFIFRTAGEVKDAMALYISNNSSTRDGSSSSHGVDGYGGDDKPACVHLLGCFIRTQSRRIGRVTKASLLPDSTIEYTVTMLADKSATTMAAEDLLIRRESYRISQGLPSTTATRDMEARYVRRADPRDPVTDSRDHALWDCPHFSAVALRQQRHARLSEAFLREGGSWHHDGLYGHGCFVTTARPALAEACHGWRTATEGVVTTMDLKLKEERNPLTVLGFPDVHCPKDEESGLPKPSGPAWLQATVNGSKQVTVARNQ
jgi:hypothetical protein